MAYFVYVLKSKCFDRFYVGQCCDIQKRIAEHNRGIVRSTNAYKPWTIHHVELYETRTAAIRREHFLKSPQGWMDLKEIKARGREFPEGIP